VIMDRMENVFYTFYLYLLNGLVYKEAKQVRWTE
jgi:hypothetical protein